MEILDDPVLLTLLLLLWLIIPLLFFLIFINCVLFCLPLLKMIKVKNMKKQNLIYIPCLNLYFFGLILENEISKSFFVFKGTKYLLSCFLPFVFLSPYFFSMFGCVVLGLLVFLFYIYMFICSVLLAKKYNSVANMVITYILGVPIVGYFTIAKKMEEFYNDSNINVLECPDSIIKTQEETTNREDL